MSSPISVIATIIFWTLKKVNFKQAVPSYAKCGLQKYCYIHSLSASGHIALIAPLAGVCVCRCMSHTKLHS